MKENLNSIHFIVSNPIVKYKIPRNKLTRNSNIYMKKKLKSSNRCK